MERSEPTAWPPPADASADDPAGDALDALQGSSIGRNLLHLLFSQVATGAFTTVLSIVQPRFLGDVQQGQLGLAASIWAISEVLTALGTSYYLTLAIARDRRRGMSLLGPVIAMRVTTFAVVAAVIGGGIVVSGANVRFAEIMAIQGAMMLLGTISDAIIAAFTGLEKLSVPATATVVARIFGTTASIGALLAGGDARSIVAIGATANLLLVVVLTRAIRRVAPARSRPSRTDATVILRGSVGFLLAALIVVVYRQIDTIVIALFVEREVLGWYATADSLAGSLLFPITIAMSSILPVIGRLHVEDPAAMRELVRRSVATLLVAAVPIGVGLMIIGRPLAPLLYGEEFRPTGPVLVVLGPVIAMTFFTVLFGSIALATERQALWNTLMVVAIVLTIPLDVVLVPWTERAYGNGAIGGALAYVVTEGLMVVVGLWRVVPYVVDRTMGWRAARVLGAAGVMAAAAWPVHQRFVAIPIAVAVVVYGVAIVVLGVVTDDDKQIAARALARVGIRTGWGDGA